MIQPKIQEVWIPTTEPYNYCLAYYDKIDRNYQPETDNSGLQISLYKKELITFTPEEFEQFKREFGKELLEKAAEDAVIEDYILGDFLPLSKRVNKSSITGVLDEFIKENLFDKNE